MVLGGTATLLQMLANVLSGIPLVGLVLGALAQVVAWAAYVCLQYTILVVQATAAIPFGSFEVARIDAPLVILFYAVLFGVTYFGIKRTGQLLVSRLWLGIGILALATMFVWTTALASPDPRTRISFIAASEGDATFIRTGDDYRILINGTGEPNTLLSFLGNQLPPWDRRLDLVVATHLDNDNLSSLNVVLERYDVGQVLEPPAPARPGVSYDSWRDLLSQRGIASHIAQTGITLMAGESTLQGVYADVNLALRLETAGRTFLFAPTLIDVERKELLASNAELDADVAVLPKEIEKGLVERITPEMMILFLGRRPQDKPTEDTLKLFEGATVLRTDERGTITFILDGEQLHSD
jgi:beta-lactamase superfamily II metal-dependent hydrolase